jgi:hypothetical protein
MSPNRPFEASPNCIASFMYHRRQSFRIIFILNIDNIFGGPYRLNYLFLIENRVNNRVLTAEIYFIAPEYLHKLISNIDEILKGVSHFLN